MKGFEAPPPVAGPEEKKMLLEQYRNRLAELKDQMRKWGSSPEDNRDVADLEEKIAMLEKETGDLSGILDKMGV